MNFLKKKLKPLTSGLTNSSTASGNQAAGSGGGKRRSQNNPNNKDLEEDLYDEYVVEAPPHPSELLALGVEPTEIDVNDPDKLRELYKRALEENKDKKTNSVLLARQRQKEELEEKKRTREEWKFFESLTNRVEEAVKSSQKTLEHLRETSAIDQLAEPDYELRQTADEVFRPVSTSKIEKDANNWIDFNEDAAQKKANKAASSTTGQDSPRHAEKQAVDEFGCPVEQRRASRVGGAAEDEGTTFVVKELLEDFGIDLRSEQQKKALELEKKQKEEAEAAAAKSRAGQKQEVEVSKTVDLKAAARPRPRPRPAGAAAAGVADPQGKREEPEVDPFDTSFVAPVVGSEPRLEAEAAAFDSSGDQSGAQAIEFQKKPEVEQKTSAFVDPFDTSHVNL